MDERAKPFTTTLYPGDLARLREIADGLPSGQKTVSHAIRALIRSWDNVQRRKRKPEREGPVP